MNARLHVPFIRIVYELIRDKKGRRTNAPTNPAISEEMANKPDALVISQTAVNGHYIKGHITAGHNLNCKFMDG